MNADLLIAIHELSHAVAMAACTDSSAGDPEIHRLSASTYETRLGVCEEDDDRQARLRVNIAGACGERLAAVEYDLKRHFFWLKMVGVEFAASTPTAIHDVADRIEHTPGELADAWIDACFLLAPRLRALEQRQAIQHIASRMLGLRNGHAIRVKRSALLFPEAIKDSGEH